MISIHYADLAPSLYCQFFDAERVLHLSDIKGEKPVDFKTWVL